MRYLVRHKTSYSYSTLVSLSHNHVHLVPRNTERQTCIVSRQQITPTPHVTRSWTDYFGNTAGFFAIEHPHQELIVQSESTVEVLPQSWPEPEQTPAWETVRDMLRVPMDNDSLEASLFRHESPFIAMIPVLREYAKESFYAGRPLLAAALELTKRIFEEFSYDPTATVVTTPLPEVWRLRRGVCQDFAHLEIACLRALGLAAHYQSGYLLTEPPPGKEKMVGADASHAWLGIWSPGSGWIGLDPTNGCLADVRHITAAWGRDFGDVSPIKGVVLGGGFPSLNVSVDVKVI